MLGQLPEHQRSHGKGVTDVYLDKLDGWRDRFESVHPSGENGGNVWAIGTPLLFLGEQDGFEGIEEHEADGFDEGGGLGGKKILERGWGSDYVDGVWEVGLGATVFGACVRICWWGIWMAVFGNDGFVGSGKGNIRELSSNVGSLVVVDLI